MRSQEQCLSGLNEDPPLSSLPLRARPSLSAYPPVPHQLIPEPNSQTPPAHLAASNTLHSAPAVAAGRNKTNGAAYLCGTLPRGRNAFPQPSKWISGRHFNSSRRAFETRHGLENHLSQSFCIISVLFTALTCLVFQCKANGKLLSGTRQPTSALVTGELLLVFAHTDVGLRTAFQELYGKPAL